jgi:Septum formation
MTRGRRAIALLLMTALAGLSGACTDWVGEDVEGGQAAVIERPDVVTPSSTSSTVPPEPVPVRALEVGGCADDVADAEGRTRTDIGAVAEGGNVLPRSCDGVHRYELYDRVELGAPDAGWPGAEQVGEDALRACTSAFESFVGVGWDQSSLDLVAVVPDEAGWAAGDRAAWCVLFDLGLAELEGSAASTGL